jgi:hypothetical protein
LTVPTEVLAECATIGVPLLRLGVSATVADAAALLDRRFPSARASERASRDFETVGDRNLGSEIL